MIDSHFDPPRPTIGGLDAALCSICVGSRVFGDETALSVDPTANINESWPR